MIKIVFTKRANDAAWQTGMEHYPKLIRGADQLNNIKMVDIEIFDDKVAPLDCVGVGSF